MDAARVLRDIPPRPLGSWRDEGSYFRDAYEAAASFFKKRFVSPVA
jgi:hypothetical protein